MKKFFGILLCLILVDFYYFPFSPLAMPAANVKLIMAVLGLAVSIFALVKDGEYVFPKPVIMVFLLSSAVSLWCLFAVVLNHTGDTEYVSYVFSCMVWLSAAFVCCYFIRMVHGEITVKLLTYYVVTVCVIQSIMAFAISRNPAIGDTIMTYTTGIHEAARNGGRMYSLGVGVDVAGSRFATALAALGGVMCIERQSMSKKEIWLCWFAIILITGFGNMVARTTIVGTAIALALVGFFLLFRFNESKALIKSVCLLLLIAIPFAVWGYNNDVTVRRQLRFAFEGFFSLFEKGHWQTNSNDNLKEMVKWPEDFSTWVFGDGYFSNALQFDQNYLGKEYTGGYYMGTDIGYFRFIYYFGLPGLLFMISVVVYPTLLCCARSPKYRLVFLAVLGCGLLIWAKVATDVWYMLALYFCICLMNPEKEDEPIQANA